MHYLCVKRHPNLQYLWAWVHYLQAWMGPLTRTADFCQHRFTLMWFLITSWHFVHSFELDLSDSSFAQLLNEDYEILCCAKCGMLFLFFWRKKNVFNSALRIEGKCSYLHILYASYYIIQVMKWFKFNIMVKIWNTLRLHAFERNKMSFSEEWYWWFLKALFVAAFPALFLMRVFIKLKVWLIKVILFVILFLFTLL